MRWWAPLLLGTVLAAQGPAAARLQALERTSGGRLGVCVVDAKGQVRLSYRAGERFPLCSTFKVLLAGAVLARVDAGKTDLRQTLPYGPKDLLAHAPVTRARVGEGALTLMDLCAASIEVSDNTAANLLLDFLGGPAAVTAFARTLEDPETRLDRREPELNDVAPGDPRDTTTPDAMARNLKMLVTTPALTPASRRQLAAWMSGCSTGTHRLRAGFPRGWVLQDKTGTGPRSTNDIAVARLDGGAPVFIAAYLDGATVAGPAQEAVLAEVGRVVAGLNW